VKKLTANYIVDSQLEWARCENITLEGRYTMRVEDNIFGGKLNHETKKEYERGKGHELEGKRAHMKALHSSSALVVNVFDYWRRQNRIQDIAKCCGAEGIVTGMEFEKTHPIKGLERTPPHLDVEFAAALRLAIESKFTEIYRRKTRRPLEKTRLDAYLKHDDIWDGMPKLKDLAQGIVQQSRDRTKFEYLDVPQLIKHILGLTCSYRSRFSLVYLWYKVESKEATQHEEELSDFRNRIDGDLDFQTMTYQGLFDSIKLISNVDPAYLKYLEQRYFPLS
jgi:hypothetical protein